MTAANGIRDLTPIDDWRQCPGFAPDGIAPHRLPADLQNFNSNKGAKNGLSTRCRVCGNLYGKAWAAAKKAGQPFSVKDQGGVYPTPAPDETPLVADAQGFLKTPYELKEAGQPSASAAARERRAAKMAEVDALYEASQTVSPIRESELNPQRPTALVEGWQEEIIDGVAYTLPTDPAVLGSPEGQAALEKVNEARARARRKRDAERKRTERANAKTAKAAQA